MVNSGKRARRRKLAQEAQRREGSRSAHQMDPVDLSRPVTDEDEEEDRESLFVPRSEREENRHRFQLQSSLLPTHEHGQDSEWGESLRFAGYGPNPAGMSSAAH